MFESPHTDTTLATRVGLDAIAIKPAECDVSGVLDVPVGTVTIDYEGAEHVPDFETLETLADRRTVRLTVPIRADGFDPLGDDSTLESLPDAIEQVLVAGHPAYLTRAERTRAVAPRLGAAVDRDPDAWVGTESVERIALATGATQYELLSRTTDRELRALRAAGFDGDVAIYAPTMLTDDADAVLDAVGAYVARRQPVAQRLPADCWTDSCATGRARATLLEAAAEYALVGTEAEVRERIDTLRDAGATTIVGYPASGLESLLE